MTSTSTKSRIFAWRENFPALLFVLVSFPLWEALRDPVLPLQGFLLCIGLIISFLLVKRKGLSDQGIPFLNPWNLLFLGFVIWQLITVSISKIPLSSLFYAQRWIILFIAFLLFQSWIFRRENALNIFVKTLSFIVLGLSFISFFQLLTGWELPGPHIPQATFFYRNLLGSGIALTLPFLLLLGVQNRGFWRWTGFFALILGIFTIVLTKSEGALIGLAVAGLVFVLILRRKNLIKHQTIRKITHPILLLLFTLIGITTLFFIGLKGRDEANLYRKIIPHYSNLQEKSNSIQERVILWRKTVELIQDHPFVGVGPGQWKVGIQETQLLAMNQTWGDRYILRPHNDFLQTGAETGILGLGLWLCLWILAGTKWIRWLKQENRPKKIVEGALVGGMLIIFLLVSLFSFPGERWFHSLMLIFAWAWISAEYPHRTQSVSFKIPRTIILFILFMLMVSSFSEVGQHFMVESRFQRSVQKNPRSNIFASTFRSSPIDPMSGLPVAFFDSKAENEDQLKLTEKALKINPYCAQAGLFRGELLVKKGQLNEAETQFRMTLNQFPMHSGCRLALIDLLRQTDQPEEAWKVFVQGNFHFEWSGMVQLKKEILEEIRLRNSQN